MDRVLSILLGIVITAMGLGLMAWMSAPSGRATAQENAPPAPVLQPAPPVVTQPLETR